jgi:hypothetical protein
VIIEEPIDPRDTEWEIDDPAYRVYFSRQSIAPSEVPQEHMGYACHEHRLSGVADVAEVLDWTQHRVQPDQTYVLYVEHRDAGRPGLLRLMGVDPTASR